jgi:pyruvate dehydrogenase E2 component (dihydrolipoamide acetyltransferase)
MKEVLMPKLGQTMEEGTVEKWHKQEGDAVSIGEVLFEVTTDKATLEVESFVEGTLRKVVVGEAETVPCNYLVALVGEADEEMPDVERLKAELAEKAGGGAPEAKVEAAEPEAEAPEVEAEQAEEEEVAPVKAEKPKEKAAAKPAEGGRLKVSPRARKVAGEKGVPLEVLEGTGPGGRIIERDVTAYLESGRKATPAARKVAGAKGVDLRKVKPGEGKERVDKEAVLGAAGAAAPVSGGEVPMSAMRRVIAKRMAESKQTAPHFYLFTEVDMGAASEVRAKLKGMGGPKVTFTDVLVKAAAAALAKNPRMNVRYEDGKILQNEAVNIGVAVAIEDGLFVPVIHGADGLGIFEVAEARAALVEKTRAGKLGPDDYTGGSVTLSNVGMFGVDCVLPIINVPESCILGVGAIREKVVAWGGGIHVRPMMMVSLCGDHRAVDGAMAAQMLKDLKELLESPEALLEGR